MTKKPINAFRKNAMKSLQSGKLRQSSIAAMHATIAPDDIIFRLFLAQEDCNGRAWESSPTQDETCSPKSLKRVHQKIRHYSYGCYYTTRFSLCNTFANICSTIFYFFKISKNVLFLAKASAVIALISIAYIWAIPSL